MAKSELQIKARQLRRNGVAVNIIANQLHVSRGSVSRWVHDIVLSREQLESLRQSVLRGGEIGRLRSAEVRREKRQRVIEQAREVGRKMILSLNERELLSAGVALYWGEGSKKNGSIQFCNSDPKMIQFFILWAEKCLHIDKDEFTCWIGINETHKSRIEEVRQFWSTVTSIPLTQFKGTSFKRVTNKKTYENYEEHFGTLFIRVKKPFFLYHKLLGMIDGLSEVAKVAQR